MLDFVKVWRRASAAAVALLLGLTALSAAPAAGAAAITTLSGFVVAGDGRLYRAPVPGAGGGLMLVSGMVVAPPGASISTVYQADGNLALFLIGTHGGLVAATSSASGSGLTVFNVGPTGLAVPGGKVSAVVASDNDVHVFFPGRYGEIYTVSFGQQVRPAPTPWRQVTLPGLVSPTASIAAGWDLDDLPGAVFMGVDGGLSAVWQQASGAWTTFAISPAAVASPDTGVAVLSGQGQPQAFVTHSDGSLWKYERGPYPEPWQPMAISAAGTVPVAAQLTAIYLGPRPNPWRPAAVFFVAADGAVKVATKVESTWLPPGATTAPGVAPPGAMVSAATTPEDPYLYVAWCGNDRLWWWLRWRKLVPPPPPPPWYGERFAVLPNPTGAIQGGYNVSAAARQF